MQPFECFGKIGGEPVHYYSIVYFHVFANVDYEGIFCECM